jgi:uncharacterized membrane protein
MKFLSTLLFVTIFTTVTVSCSDSKKDKGNKVVVRVVTDNTQPQNSNQSSDQTATEATPEKKSAPSDNTPPQESASKEEGDKKTPETEVTASVLFEKVIQPKCASCHASEPGLGGVVLTKDWLLNNAPTLVAVTLLLEGEEAMPPVGLPQLTKEEKEMISKWIIGGKKE